MTNSLLFIYIVLLEADVIVCLEFSTKTKDDLDRLLLLGGYRDYSEAVALAVSNQLVLHGQSDSAGTVPSPQNNPRNAGADTNVGIAKKLDQTARTRAPGGIPALFRIISAYSEPPENCIAEPPEDPLANGQHATIDRWIFSQHNKLLPLKASIRALANILLSERGPISLMTAGPEIAIAAEHLGAHLRGVDDAFGLIREDSLSTAFPSPAVDINKSRLRFASQFVGAVNKHNKLRGFPADLKLLNLRIVKKEPRVFLTNAGWAFARLPNPVLDCTSQGRAEKDKLSNEERDFLLGHIKHHVPAEYSAITYVLQSLSAGAQSPDDVDRILRQQMVIGDNEPFTPAFLSAQRAGVVSRMTDLDLISRERDGLRVKYVASESGRLYTDIH